MYFKKKLTIALFIIVISVQWVNAQFKTVTQFTPDGKSYYLKQDNGIVKVDIKTGEINPVIKKEQLTPLGATMLSIASFSFSNDNSKLLVFTNTAKVWRYNTRGDYCCLLYTSDAADE